MSGIKIKTHMSAPIDAGEITLQPISQSVHWIEKRFGLVWNRPYAIRVEHGQSTYQLPIRDMTRVYLILLWGLTAIFSLVFLSAKPNRRSKK